MYILTLNFNRIYHKLSSSLALKKYKYPLIINKIKKNFWLNYQNNYVACLSVDDNDAKKF